ncbi:MAG: hypothetical protein Sw1PiTSA_21890 [Shewanella algae]|uniref:hypothetical protein n=1 Tax=Shewanella algae TaxID=38313 RepID=UPI0007874D56|nr:hypothetical protein [Shewanella algae]MBO2619045.1 hypothetical protein [Shewanella algae]NKZ41462.1 hypothetical protein [Shewanella algae]PSS69340.1 hypothetical protein AYI85_11460 [Shewanella algae]QTE78771.1 hypothetical protein E1N14_003700 [Shewanella algae]TVK99557.1 hypothetical protein AYI84_18505 [Shewanella algae]
MDTGVVIGLLGSAILAYLIPKLAPYIDSMMRKISHILKGPFRKIKLKRLNEIRAMRYNQDAVMFQSIKAHSYFMLFWGVIAFYVLLLVMGPLYKLLEESLMAAFISFLPLYVFEVYWLLEADKAKKLVRHRGLLACNKLSKSQH